MKDSNYEAAEEWRGLNNYKKEVMYDGSGDADDVFLFLSLIHISLRIFGNIDFISRKTPKILILSAKLNILKKDVADESMNINPQIQNNLLRR